MGSQTKTSLQKPKKQLVSKSFIIMFALIILLPVGLVGSFGLQCKIRQKIHKSNQHDFIQAYFDLKLTTATSEIKKDVQTGGDCFDSNPWIRARQTYSVDATGSEIVDEFKNNMKAQGYVVTNEQYYYSKTCGVKYTVNAGNGPTNISFAAANYSLTGGCNNNDEYQFKDPAYFLQSKTTNVYSTLLNQ